MGEKCVYRRRDGRFEARLCIGKNETGKRVTKSFYGRTADEALEKMYGFKRTLNIGSLTEMTVRELCYEWLNVVQSRIKPSTLANYRMKLEKHIIPAFSGFLCHKLTRQDVYAFIGRKLESGLSARYVSDIIVLLKSVFKYARREHHIAYIFDDIIMPKCISPQVRLLDADQQNALKAYISKCLDLTKLGIMLSLTLGLRLGEVCGLQWKDIDLQKRVLSVNKTVQRVAVAGESAKTKLVIMPPKSESSVREIPLPKQLAMVLKGFESAPETFVLSANEKPLEPRTLQYRFAAILDNANIPSVTFHSLRHAFATNAIALGFDVKTLSEILGHSKVEITLNRYVHSSMDRKRACMELVKCTA